MKQLSVDEQKRARAEYLWLSYFNHTLLDKGIISQQEFYKIQTQLLTRKPLGEKASSQSYEMEM